MVLLNTFGGVFRPDLLLNIYTLSWCSEKQNGASWYKTNNHKIFASKISIIGRDELSSFRLFIGYFERCAKKIFLHKKKWKKPPSFKNNTHKKSFHLWVERFKRNFVGIHFFLYQKKNSEQLIYGYVTIILSYFWYKHDFRCFLVNLQGRLWGCLKADSAESQKNT